jgi:hypothetical protein
MAGHPHPGRWLTAAASLAAAGLAAAGLATLVTVALALTGRGEAPEPGCGPAVHPAPAATTSRRHRHPDQRDRPDSHPPRLGAHHLAAEPFAGATVPAAELVPNLRGGGREKPGERGGARATSMTGYAAAAMAAAALLCVCGNWPW